MYVLRVPQICLLSLISGLVPLMRFLDVVQFQSQRVHSTTEFAYGTTIRRFLDLVLRRERLWCVGALADSEDDLPQEGVKEILGAFLRHPPATDEKANGQSPSRRLLGRQEGDEGACQRGRVLAGHGSAQVDFLQSTEIGEQLPQRIRRDAADGRVGVETAQIDLLHATLGLLVQGGEESAQLGPHDFLV